MILASFYKCRQRINTEVGFTERVDRLSPQILLKNIKKDTAGDLRLRALFYLLSEDEYLGSGKDAPPAFYIHSFRRDEYIKHNMISALNFGILAAIIKIHQNSFIASNENGLTVYKCTNQESG